MDDEEHITRQRKPSFEYEREEKDEDPHIFMSDEMKVANDDPLVTGHGQEGDRQAWGGKMEFLFSCLSYAVGLGNVWRFPYLCYKNGGGAFLLPFALMLFVIGIPLMFMETCFGQYSATGPVTVWRASPLFTGIGWSMFMITFSGSIYYNMLIAWTLFYFFKSFTNDLPWTTCTETWNTNDCIQLRQLSQRNRCQKVFNGFVSFRHNFTCLLPGNASVYMHPEGDILNEISHNVSKEGPSLAPLYEKALELNATNATSNLTAFLGSIMDPKTSSDEYFHNFVLSISDGFHELGIPRWQLVLCLFAAWIIVILCLIRGVKSAGKAVYFTAIFPYLVLTILLIRGVTLEGAMDGLRFLFIPNWNRLLDARVWGDAAVQVFFSLSPGWGGIIALSSYNKFHNNALLDALIVSIGDGLTSVYAGMTVFCVLGYMSNIMSLPIEKVAKDGAGLAFILYPDIVTSLPVSPLWAVLFFAMLLTLGFGTMISNVNTIKTAVCDNWPHKFSGPKKHFMVLCTLCFIAFIFGIPCTTQGGMFVLQLLDNYCCTYAVLVVGFMELIVITWVYGADRFVENVEEIMQRKISVVWKYMWKFVSPLIILAIAIFNIVFFKRSHYDKYVFPIYADILGGIISVLIVVPIPAVAIYMIKTSKLPMDWRGRARELMKPDRRWCREMGRNMKPKDWLVDDPAAAFESQQPLAQNMLIQSSSTIAQSQHRL